MDFKEQAQTYSLKWCPINPIHKTETDEHYWEGEIGLKSFMKEKDLNMKRKNLMKIMLLPPLNLTTAMTMTTTICRVYWICRKTAICDKQTKVQFLLVCWIFYQ